jgi:hypothetical protein
MTPDSSISLETVCGKFIDLWEEIEANDLCMEFIDWFETYYIGSGGSE